MNQRSVPLAVVGLTLLSLLAASGCNTTYGPRLGIFGYPIPLTPYLQDDQEDRFWEKERYGKVPILEPFTPGGPTTALDAPSHDEIMRALERARPIEGGLPFLHEIQRNNVRIQIEPMADTVDPVRVYPLIGPAQLHHARYRCTVYFSEVTRVGWPIPYTTKNEDAQEVIYIDHDHLHMVGNVDPGSGGAPVANPAAVPVATPAQAGMPQPGGMPMAGGFSPQRPYAAGAPAFPAPGYPAPPPNMPAMASYPPGGQP